MKEKLVIAITGPASAGKSTAAAELAKRFERSAHIEADQFKHFIVNGFLYDNSPEGVMQWRLLGKNVGTAAHNFQREGYAVIVDGFIDEPAWEELQKHVTLSHKFLLLPRRDVVAGRNAARPQYAVSEAAVVRHHNYFCQWYTLVVDKLAGDFIIQEDEVEQVRWFAKAELENDLRQNPQKYLQTLAWTVETL